MKDKKYCLIDGFVYSADGDKHYIPPFRLAKLYGVSMDECLIAPPDKTGWRPPESIIPLYPQDDGNYSLPDAT